MISERNLKFVRNFTKLLYMLRVIPFQWNEKLQKFIYSPHRLRFTYIHGFSAICHIILPLPYLINCGTSTAENREQACNKTFLNSCFFSITWQILILIELTSLIQDDAEQAVIAHNWVESFVARIRRNNETAILKYHYYYIDVELIVKFYFSRKSLATWKVWELALF